MLLNVILTVAIAGVFVWAILTYVPMPEPFRRAIYVLSVVGLLIYLGYELNQLTAL